MKYKPLPDSLTINQSGINGLGLFAKESLKQGTNLGMTHIQISETIVRTPLGGFINHKDNPNCEKVKLLFTHEDYRFTKYNLITIKDIKGGEELTLNYTFYTI